MGLNGVSSGAPPIYEDNLNEAVSTHQEKLIQVVAKLAFTRLAQLTHILYAGISFIATVIGSSLRALAERISSVARGVVTSQPEEVEANRDNGFLEIKGDCNNSGSFFDLLGSAKKEEMTKVKVDLFAKVSSEGDEVVSQEEFSIPNSNLQDVNRISDFQLVSNSNETDNLDLHSDDSKESCKVLIKRLHEKGFTPVQIQSVLLCVNQKVFADPLIKLHEACDVKGYQVRGKISDPSTCKKIWKVQYEKGENGVEGIKFLVRYEAQLTQVNDPENIVGRAWFSNEIDLSKNLLNIKNPIEIFTLESIDDDGKVLYGWSLDHAGGERVREVNGLFKDYKIEWLKYKEKCKKEDFDTQQIRDSHASNIWIGNSKFEAKSENPEMEPGIYVAGILEAKLKEEGLSQEQVNRVFPYIHQGIFADLLEQGREIVSVNEEIQFIVGPPVSDFTARYEIQVIKDDAGEVNGVTLTLVQHNKLLYLDTEGSFQNSSDKETVLKISVKMNLLSSDQDAHVTYNWEEPKLLE